MDPQDGEIGFPKYTRTGYVDQGRKSDELLAAFLKEIPGDGYLPARWRTDSDTQFMADYGYLGTVLWSASYSAHLLVVGGGTKLIVPTGTKILRIWTDAKRHCWVESQPHVLQGLLQPIPEKNIRKSKPFLVRQKFTTTEDISALAKRVRMMYGI